MMAELIKHFMHPLIDLIMKIGKMSTAVMIAGLGQVKNLDVGYNPVKPVSVPMFHFIHPEFRTGVLLRQLFKCRLAISFYMK